MSIKAIIEKLWMHLTLVYFHMWLRKSEREKELKRKRDLKLQLKSEKTDTVTDVKSEIAS